MTNIVNNIDDLIKLGEYLRAEELCLENLNNKEVFYRYLNVLVFLNSLEDAEKYLYKYKNDEDVQAHYISCLIDEKRFVLAEKICKRFPNSEIIQNLYLEILMIKGRNYDAYKICYRFKNSPLIQSKYITLLTNQNKFHEAKRICEKFLDVEEIKTKYDSINKKLEFLKDRGNMQDEIRINEDIDYLNYIYAKIRIGNIKKEDIDNIDSKNISLFTKILISFTYYYKTNNYKVLESQYKYAKKAFENDEVKLKIINKIYSKIKNSKIFDISIFDNYIPWNASRYNEIKEENKLKDELEKTQKLTENKLSNKIVNEEVISNVSKKTSKPKRNYETFYISTNRTKKDNKSKKEILKETKETLIDDVFHDLIFELTKEIYVRANSETNIQNKKIYINHLDFIENISYKSINDLKSLKKLLGYLKKYNINATEEIIDSVNKLSKKLENNNF